MNPLTNVRNIQKLNERMLEMGVEDGEAWHKQYKDSAYIFIGGLPYDLTEGDVLCVFSQYGEIVNINLVRDKNTGKSKGYCFLCYEDQQSTVLAVDNFNGIKLGGRVIRVDHCSHYRRPKSDEKDKHGNRKEVIEKGCAPKTPSPSPSSSEDEIGVLELPKKRSKNKKAKKHKKNKDKLEKRKKLSSGLEDHNDKMWKQELPSGVLLMGGEADAKAEKNFRNTGLDHVSREYKQVHRTHGDESYANKRRHERRDEKGDRCHSHSLQRREYISSCDRGVPAHNHGDRGHGRYINELNMGDARHHHNDTCHKERGKTRTDRENPPCDNMNQNYQMQIDQEQKFGRRKEWSKIDSKGSSSSTECDRREYHDYKERRRP